jgi:hypothetical protein
LEARATQGVVTLPEVTDMLQRVFTGALHRDEYSAAHNAAFSLARLYGHVTDRSTVEVIRRPSRDPDAPSEQALASWVNSLPVIEHVAASSAEGGLGAFRDAPASLLGTVDPNLAPVPSSSPTVASSSPTAADNLAAVASDLAPVADPIADATHSHLGQRGNASDFNDLAVCSRSVQVGGRPENRVPTTPVTGTPDSGAHADPLGPAGGSEKEAPLPNRQVPGTPAASCATEYPAASCATEYPPAEELF